MLVDTSDLVSVTELGRGLSRYVNDTAETGRRFVILNSNTATAALVSIGDLEKLQALDTEAAATAPPPTDEPLTLPTQEELEQRPGMTAVGRDEDGQDVYWSLTEHQFVAGRRDQGASLLFSAAIAGAVPDPRVATEFVVATSTSHTTLRHQRLHPDIPIAVESDLDELHRKGQFLEKLDAELSRRRALLREHKVDTLAELRQISKTTTEADLPNLVVVLTDPSALAKAGAVSSYSTLGPVLTFLARQGADLGIYLWLGLPDSDREAALRRLFSQDISRRYAMGTFESAAESRDVVGTDAAARGPVPLGTGWVRGAPGEGVKRFAVVEPTGGPGDVVTAGGRCQCWPDGLTEPLALADIPEVSADNGSGLTIPIGITDGQPGMALTVTVNGSTPHLCIIGGDGSGCTTALRTFVASAAMRYRPRECTLMLIGDAGKQLAELPNVCAAATELDTDRVERILGEALRIIAIRQVGFDALEVSTLDDYLVSRTEEPVADDPYGRLIVVIDDVDRIAGDYKDQLEQLALTGGLYGVHLVTTTHRPLGIPLKIAQHLSFPIRLGGLGAGEEPVTVSRRRIELRELAKSLPIGQRGRCIDTLAERHARIALPYAGHFDQQSDGDPADRLRQLVDAAAWAGEPADRLTTVPTSIAPEDFWRQLDANHTEPAAGDSGERRAAMDVRIPLGVAITTASVADVPDEQSPHLLAVGSTGSGRTVLLRALIAAIRHRFSADGADGRPEAKIVLIDGLDGRHDLAGERMNLARDGYLLSDEVDPDKAISAVAATISSRVPTDGHPPLSAEQRRDRSWYQGPEVFVLLDLPMAPMAGAAFQLNGPTWPAELARLIDGRNDLGLHVYVAAPASRFSTARLTDPLYRSLEYAPTVLLSGPPSEGVVWPGSGIRFKLRPSGRGQLVNPATLDATVIQIPWYQPE